MKLSCFLLCSNYLEWLNNTTFYLGCSCSATRGLGRPACCAGSRKMNLILLTSPPSVSPNFDHDVCSQSFSKSFLLASLKTPQNAFGRENEVLLWVLLWGRFYSNWKWISRPTFLLGLVQSASGHNRRTKLTGKYQDWNFSPLFFWWKW